MSNQLKGAKFIEELELKDQRVFLRLDLNLPMHKGEISDETRLQAALPTIKYCLEKGAKLVVSSHMGRPKTDEHKKTLSLEPVAKRLGDLLNIEVILIEEPDGEAPKALLRSLKPNQLIMLENLRFHPDETKNGDGLVNSISEYIDIYINDAFGASHRAHASIVGLAKSVKPKNRAYGFLIKKETDVLNKMLTKPDKPFVAVLGGAKISDKIGVIEKLIDQVDSFIIGGAMAYTFLAADNQPTGTSLVEKDKLNFARKLVDRLKVREKNIYLPIDHVVSKSFTDTSSVKTIQIIPNDMMALDIGSKTIKLYQEVLKTSKMCFWNGPMGVFEKQNCEKGTFAIAESLASNNGFNIVGGGDSASAAHASGFADKMSHISTGGGASLEYLQGIRLPGIEALKPPMSSEPQEV